MSNQELSLGTIFTGQVDASFAKATARLKALMRDLLKVQTRMGSTKGIDTFSNGITLADERISRLGKAMVRASENGRKYEQTLAGLTKHIDKNSLSINDAERAMYQSDKVLRQLTRTYGTQLQQTAMATRNWGQFSKQWRDFKDLTNLNTVAQKVFNGQIQATEKGIKSYITNASGGTITFDRLAKAHKAVWPQIGKVNRAIDAGITSWEHAARAQVKWQAGLGKIDSRKGATEKISKGIQTAAKDSSVLSQALDRAGKHGTQYKNALGELTRYMDANSLSVKDAEKALYKTDGILRQLGRTYKTQVKKDLSAVNWGSFKEKINTFKNATDLTTVSQKVLSGEIKGTSKDIQDYLKRVSGGQIAFDGFTKGAKSTYPVINKVNRAIDDGTLSWHKAAREQAQFYASTQKAGSSARKLESSAKAMSAQPLSKHFRDMTKGTHNMSQVWRYMNRQIDEGLMSWQDMAKFQNEWQKKNSKSVAGTRQQGSATQDLGAQYRKVIKSGKDTWPVIDKVNRAIDTGKMSWQQAALAQVKYTANLKKGRMGEAATSVQSLSNKFKNLVGTTNNVRRVWRAMNAQVDQGNMSWQDMAKFQAEWQKNNIKSLSKVRTQGNTAATTAGFRKVIKSGKDTWPVIDKINQKIDEGTISWHQAAREQARYMAGLQKNKLNATAKSVQTLSSKFKDMAGSAKGMTRVWRTMNAQVDAGKMSWQDMARIQASYQAKTAKKTVPAVESLSKKFKDIAGSAKGVNRIWRTMNAQIDAGAISWQQAARTQAKWQAENIKANAGIRRYGEALGQSSSRSRRAKRDTDELAKAHSFLGKQIGRVEGGWNRIKAAMKVTASYGLAATALYSVVGSLQAGGREIIAFDQALKNLQAITKATNAETSVMGATIKQVAKDTKYSAVEVSEGMRLIGQAGFNAGESVQIIGSAASLAAGTMESMENTTDLMSTALKAFNMKAIESSRVADVMANAVNMSKLTIDKLRVAFNYVGASSHQANISLEETAATLMVLANNGLRASTIGTGMRQILSRLVSPNEKLREAYEHVGIELEKINPLTVGWEGAVKSLSQVLWNNEKNTIDMAKAYALFGLRGAQAAAVIVKSFRSGDFQKALENTYEVGAAEEMAAKQAEGLGFKLKNLGDRAKNLAITVGEGGLVGVFTAFIDVGRGVLGMLDSIGSTMGGQVILQTVAWTAAIYGLIKAFTALKTVILTSHFINTVIFSFNMWSIAIGKTAASLKMLTMIVKSNPWLWLSAAIAATGVALWRYLHVNDRAILQHQQLAVEYKKVGDSLEVYAGAFENMKKRIAEGDDVSREYSSTLQRLIKEHPEIAEAVKLHSESIDGLTDALREYIQAKRELETEEEIRAMEALRQKIELEVTNWGIRTKIIGAMRNQLDLHNLSMEDGIAILKNSGEASKQFRSSLIELDGAIIRVAHSLADWILSGEKTEDQVVEFISTLSEEKYVVDELTKAFKEALRAKRAFQEKEDTDFQQFLGELPEKFQKTLSDLGEKDPLKAVQFLESIKQMEGRISRFKTMAEKMKYSHEQINKGIEAIYADTLSSVMNKAAKTGAGTVKRIEHDIKEIRGRFEELRYERDKELAAVKGNAAAEEKVRTYYDQRLQEMRAESNQRMAEISAQSLRLKGDEIGALEQELAVLRELRTEKEMQMQQMDNADDMRDVLIDLEQLDNEIFEKEGALVEVNFAKRLEATKKFSDEYSKIMDEQLDAGKINMTEWQSYYDDLAEHEMEMTEYKYNRNLVSAEEYFEKLKVLYQRGLIDDEEFEKKQHELLDTPAQRFTWGIEQARREAESWGDTMERIGFELEDQFSTNLTGGILDFIEGTKSAKEAFADFAQNMIRWLAEIAIKQAILKGLSVLGGMGGGGLESVNWSGWDLYHSGGIVGRDRTIRTKALSPLALTSARRFHSGGLASDEVPAVLRRGEGVFTQEQMKALGSVMRQPDNVFFFDKRLFDAYLATPAGQNAVVNIVGKNFSKFSRR